MACTSVGCDSFIIDKMGSALGRLPVIIVIEDQTQTALRGSAEVGCVKPGLHLPARWGRKRSPTTATISCVPLGFNVYFVPLLFGAELTGTTVPRQGKNARQKLVKTLAVFSLCWVPIHTLRLDARPVVPVRLPR